MITLVKPKGVSEDNLTSFVKKLDSYVYSNIHDIIVLKQDDQTIYRTKYITSLKFLLDILHKTYDIGIKDEVILILRTDSDAVTSDRLIKTLKRNLDDQPGETQMIYEDLFIPVDLFPSVSKYRIGGIADRWLTAQSGKPRVKDSIRSRKYMFAKNVLYTTGVTDVISGNIDYHSTTRVNETILESVARGLDFRFLLVRTMLDEERGKIILPMKELWEEEDGIIFALSTIVGEMVNCDNCNHGVTQSKGMCPDCKGTGEISRQNRFIKENQKIHEVGKIVTVARKIPSSISSFKAIIGAERLHGPQKKINIESVFTLDAETHRAWGIGEHIYIAIKDAYCMNKGDKFVITGFSEFNHKHRFVLHKIKSITQTEKGNANIVMMPKHDTGAIRTLSLGWYLSVFKKLTMPYDVITYRE